MTAREVMVLDTGALIALERRRQRMMAIVHAAKVRKIPLLAAGPSSPSGGAVAPTIVKPFSP